MKTLKIMPSEHPQVLVILHESGFSTCSGYNEIFGTAPLPLVPDHFFSANENGKPMSAGGAEKPIFYREILPCDRTALKVPRFIKI